MIADKHRFGFFDNPFQRVNWILAANRYSGFGRVRGLRDRCVGRRAFSTNVHHDYEEEVRRKKHHESAGEKHVSEKYSREKRGKVRAENSAFHRRKEGHDGVERETSRHCPSLCSPAAFRRKI